MWRGWWRRSLNSSVASWRTYSDHHSARSIHAVAPAKACSLESLRNFTPPRTSSHGNWRTKRAVKHLSELLLDTLKDIYYAEKKILSTLPKMAKAAQSSDLKAAFEKHEGETEGQIERLEQVFEIIGALPRGKKCDAIEGIIDEGKEIMQEYKGSPALDAGLLAAAQAVEHYEISRYGTLKTWAAKLGHQQAVSLLDQTLQQEKKTDADLSKIAETGVNAEAE
jgi:ferritin-like metal-binding protein YciE